MKKHVSTCQNKYYKGIEIKSIVQIYTYWKHFFVRKYKPTVYSPEE